MFWQIYCPVFAALVSAFLLSELVQGCLGWYLRRKYAKMREDFDDKVANGEIDPMQLMLESMGGMGPGAMGNPMTPPPLPTASGQENGTGQYL